MELLVVLIIWCLYCHFFVKPYEARKKMEVKKKKRKKRGLLSSFWEFTFLEKSLITKSCVTMAANFMSKGKSKSLFKCSSVWNVRRGFSCYNRKKSLPLRVNNPSVRI